jgi:23S rRNA (cytosine1962-C5)-methyltransferase
MGHQTQSSIEVLSPDGWRDYELLDSGGGMRLERFGAYTLARPDPEAVWRRRLPDADWARAEATFQHGETSDRWTRRRTVAEQWPMQYGALAFFARLTPFKHTGVFPEQAVLWKWMQERISAGHLPVNVLTLFGYTGLAALAAAQAGARVTYVDASKWAMDWARSNQSASHLDAKPIRWLVDDALKFVRREARRGARYDAIVMDPPSFGRGPQGEVWKFSESFPPLLDACVALLSGSPLFVAVTCYAVDLSALALGNLLDDALGTRSGTTVVGELALCERSSGRLLSTSLFARWTPNTLKGAHA